MTILNKEECGEIGCLGYHNNDYRPIFSSQCLPMGTLRCEKNLKINSGQTSGYSYLYDQLNRLLGMKQHNVSGATWSYSSYNAAYEEKLSYDANGNIKTLVRKGANLTGMPLAMDNLKYFYYYTNTGNARAEYDPTAALPADVKSLSNQLAHVSDSDPDANYTDDIDNQAAGNYDYDNIGNLIKDTKEGITGIEWTVYGKIKQINKGAVTIKYAYDPGGNRVRKEVTGAPGANIKQFYIRDAQGNTLAIYNVRHDDAEWAEQHLFGSSRLGIWSYGKATPTAPGAVVYDSTMVGSVSYELTNHLANVLATISDKKVGVSAGKVTVDYYSAEVMGQNDYYSFGSLMPGRTFNAVSLSGVEGYRYGFNGQEKSMELNGSENLYTAEFWQYDGRIGRRWNVEPLFGKVPNLSPYSAFGDNPVRNIDPDGQFLLDVHQRIAKNALMGFAFELFKRDKKHESFDQAYKNDVKNSSFMFGIVGQGTIFSGGITGPDWNQSKVKASHFDEMNFTQVISNAESIKQKAANLITQYKGGGINEENLGYEVGKQLHAIADLYSHSNYVELYIQVYGKKGDINSIPTLNEALSDSKYEKFASLLKTDLHSGKYPGSGAGSHKEMNHDVGAGSNYTNLVPETFGKKVTYETKAAEAVATKASKEYLRGLKTDIEKKP